MRRYAFPIILSVALATGAVAGCGSASAEVSSPSNSAGSVAASTVATAAGSATSLIDTSDLFTDRDMKQTADTSNATSITVKSGEDVTISEEGVYVLSGTAENTTIKVEADSSAKVQLVLDGLNITNSTAPAIYVTSADKVFVTTASGSTNSLKVTGTFATTSEDNIDGVIFAKDDIVLNGQGTLNIESSANGVVGKDDVKVTGGTYAIKASGHAIQGKDSVAIADGMFDLDATTDGIHAENSDDQTLGYVYVSGGTFDIDSESDGIEGDAFVIIDGGTFDIDSAEGVEGTFVQINGGTIDIAASDDGVNGTSKSSAYAPTIEINGGELAIAMGSGDTDALDVNGNLYINGGAVDITAQSPFDFDGAGQISGGTVTVNGQQVTELTNSMMGGGMGGRGNMDSMGAQPGMDSSGNSADFGMYGHGGKGSRGSMGYSDGSMPSSGAAAMPSGSSATV